ncbi:DUF445 family protein [Desulfurivibrio alkaliphilus]|uniref:DUF445 family protein n=1 Tax=Desulfurivibrio alkaliphilus (strain DSM 19089 / UNIQEM U267 / AHT2) TaxID=589865 RepID=D6YZY2_DESAT|nr:DUF445 family protein [Desulfurivibrio alkaliphilus]ADH85139.1 protein of unknown function DUF445 [Desulfurivibrio alkaliphilus AHT 2]
MSIVAYLSLPLVGALIGYLTNHIAIRMLFRPLRPWHLAGRRLPLTPGVIPAARHRLAANIGKMVGEHLLTPQDIRRALGQDDFQHNLRLLIQTQTEAIMQTPFGPVESLVPAAFRSYFRVGVKVVRWRFLKQLHQHLQSPEFAATLTAVSEEHFNEVMQRRLDQVLPEEQRQELVNAVSEQLHQAMAAPAFQQGVADYLNRQFVQLLADGRSLAELLPAPLLNALLERLEQQAPRLLEHLAELLARPEAQEKVATGLGEALHQFSRSLGPMGAVLGNLITPETVAGKIRSWLGRKGENAGHWLLDEEARRQLAAAMRREAEKFCHRPLGELLADIPPAQLDQARRELAQALGRLLARPETATLLNGVLHEALNAHRELPLASLLQNFWGEDAAERGQRFGQQELLRLLRSRRTKRMLDRLLIDLTETRLLAQPLGRPADLLPREIKTGINDYLQEQINLLLEREVPQLIDALNIREIVTRKVDRLDLLQLEGLLLSIMQDQFKYINFFGALIGFLIGLFNLLILTVF